MKQKLFITLILCVWIPVAYAAGIPHLLPWPQQIDWNKQTFSGKEITLQAEGNTEQMVTAWLQENNIGINPASKHKLQIKLVKELPEAKLVLQVHDELIVECPEDQAAAAAKLLEEEMEQVAHLSVPLTAEAHWGRNWLEAKG